MRPPPQARASGGSAPRDRAATMSSAGCSASQARHPVLAARMERAAGGERAQARRRARYRGELGRAIRRDAAPSAAAPSCRACAAPSNSDATGSCFVTSPAYITIARSAISPTTPRLCVMKMIDMPLRCCMRRNSSRICAWMVTSSAVVGSSAIRMLRIAGQRDRDHHALAHAARELVRIAREALLRIGDAELGQLVARLVPRGARIERLMLPQRFGDLRADRVDRVERRHRLLEDHRDVVAAHLAQRAIVEREDVAARAVLAGEMRPRRTRWCRARDRSAP